MAIIDADVRNEIFNVSGGFEQANVDTVKKVIGAYYDPEVEWKDYVDFSYDREGQDVRYALDDSKLRKLGWEPERNFDDEINEIVSYHKENFRW
jgi:dTDP-D-glucose 4,6-dehydratase